MTCFQAQVETLCYDDTPEDDKTERRDGLHAFIEGSEQIDSKGSLYERGEIVTQSKHPSTYLYYLFEFFTLKHGCLQRLLTPLVCVAYVPFSCLLRTMKFMKIGWRPRSAKTERRNNVRFDDLFFLLLCTIRNDDFLGGGHECQHSIRGLEEKRNEAADIGFDRTSIHLLC